MSKRLDKNTTVSSNRLDKPPCFLSSRLNSMDKQLLKSVMLDNQKEVQRYEVFKRDFHFEDFGNYVLIGIRRAGKSFLIYQRIQQLLTEGVGWDSMLYINFEDERLDGLQVSELNLIIEAHLEMYGKRPILFLDEIQNIEGWEKFARRLADENIRYTSPEAMPKCLVVTYKRH